MYFNKSARRKTWRLIEFYPHYCTEIDSDSKPFSDIIHINGDKEVSRRQTAEFIKKKTPNKELNEPK